MATLIESPLTRLTPEQIEQIGREFDAIHDEVKAELGDRDRRYITSMIEMHRRLVVLAPGAAARLALPAGVDRRHDDAVAGQDPREHGDRPQRDARPVGLDERSPDQLLHLGLGHRLDARGVEALPQLRPPHVHEHPRQGPRPRLRDHADRPAPEVASGLPLPAVLQPACWRRSSSGASPLHDLDFDAIRTGEKSKAEVKRQLKGMAGKARSQIVKDYVAWPLLSGLAMAPSTSRSRRGRRARSRSSRRARAARSRVASARSARR